MTIILAFSLTAPIRAFAEDAPPADPPPAAENQPPAEEPPAEEAPEEEPPAEETTELPAPVLTAITFVGAEIDGEFSSDVFEYNLQVLEHSDTVQLASYKCPDYNAQVKVYYLTNSSGDASGLVVKLENKTASNEYKFLFDSIKELKKTPDASLMSLTFDYGELSPKFSADVFKYTLYLPSDLEVLNINAVTSDENAKVNTPSQITIGADKNFSLSVKITSSDGTNTALYKLNVKRVNKTIAQIKEEMDNPDFETFVEIPFYQTAPFYIGLGVTLFLIALALVLFFTLRKKKAPAPALEDGDTLFFPDDRPEDGEEKQDGQTPPSNEKETAEQETTEPVKPDVPPTPVKKPEPPAAQPKKEQTKEEPVVSKEVPPTAAVEKPQSEAKKELPQSPPTAETIAKSDATPGEKAPEKPKKERKQRTGFFSKRKKQASEWDETDLNEPQNDSAVFEPTETTKQEIVTKPAEKQASKKDNTPVINTPAAPAPAPKQQAERRQNTEAPKTSENERTSSLPTDDWLDLDKYKKYK